MDEYSLTLKYEKLIYKIARKFYNVELDDLYQAGCIGLIKAYRNYDETSPVPFMNYAYNMCRSHHERWDGSGYPDKLAGEKIPVEARALAIVNAYDAYDKAQALKKQALEKLSGEQA